MRFGYKMQLFFHLAMFRDSRCDPFPFIFDGAKYTAGIEINPIVGI